MSVSQFQPVFDPTPEDTAAQKIATNTLLLGLKTVSQRAVAALLDLFTLITVASAWWLWWSTPDPNVHQIVSLGLYALFVLAANIVVRRRR